MASGAAVALLESGFEVVLAEIPNPLSVRRLVCFSEAVYEGLSVVDGWRGVLMDAAAGACSPGQATVIVDPLAIQMQRLRPDVVIDARMTKAVPVPLPVGSAPVVGLGPGFTAGAGADLVIETVRGPRLGAVIDSGAAAPYSGMPGLVGGQTATRVLRSPAAGHLVPLCRIGDLVQMGQVVGHVGGKPVVCGIAGVLRGLVHRQAELVVGEKVGDVDPRGAGVDPAALTDKARVVGQGTLAAVRRLLTAFA